MKAAKGKKSRNRYAFRRFSLKCPIGGGLSFLAVMDAGEGSVE
jgi:hypothetical protein